MFNGYRHDVASACQPCLSMAYTAFGLKTGGPQPAVREREALTAMIVFPVVDSKRASVSEDGAVSRHAVRNARLEFRQVKRCVRVVANPEKEHLPIEVVDTAHRAFVDVGRQREWISSDAGRLRPHSREGKAVIAS